MQRAWRVGFGTDTVDPRDPQMQDAAALCTTDHQGSALWHPRGLADIDAIGARTWRLWEAMQHGLAARAEPWAWWRVKGIPTSHLFEATPLGRPEVARCGWRGAEGAEWVRTAHPPQCRACAALTEQDTRPQTGWGRVGDVVIGPDGRPMEAT